MFAITLGFPNKLRKLNVREKDETPVQKGNPNKVSFSNQCIAMERIKPNNFAMSYIVLEKKALARFRFKTTTVLRYMNT
jgi:hypothetical protein